MSDLLRRVTLDWSYNPAAQSIVNAIEDEPPRRRGYEVSIAQIAPGTVASPNRRYLVVAAASPSHNLNLDIESGRARIVVGIDRVMGNRAAAWFTGLTPAREKLGTLVLQGLNVTAVAVPASERGAQRVFLAEAYEDGRLLRRLPTVGVTLLGEPVLAPQPPVDEASIYAMNPDIPVILLPPLGDVPMPDAEES